MSKESTRALAGPRTMSKLIPPYNAARGATTWGESNGWTSKSGFNMIMYETYFDMDGFTRDAMTTFPESAAIQDPGDYVCSNPATRFNFLDIICTERLPLALVNTWLESQYAVPGMSPTTVDWSQIIWGQWRSMMPQATFQGNSNVLLTSNLGSFGSGQPTTARKLWVYRFVWLFQTEENDQLVIPASRIILNSIQAQEDDKEFLMRQKRSYELGDSN
jgi:hypothetical protein